MEIMWLIFYVIEPMKSGSILNYRIHLRKDVFEYLEPTYKQELVEVERIR